MAEHDNGEYSFSEAMCRLLLGLGNREKHWVRTALARRISRQPQVGKILGLKIQ
jgi:hypothetical protein